MLAQLEGFAFVQLSALDAASLDVAASELAALEQTIGASPELRALLGDTSINGVTRAAILSDLLADKVRASTSRMAAYAAEHVPAPEVAATIGLLAHFAREMRLNNTVEFANLSLLEARRRVNGYADALLEGLDVASFAAIEAELFEWARVVEHHDDLRRLLVDRDAPLEVRLGTSEQLLSGRVNATTLALARFVITGGRPRDVVGTLDALVIYVAALRDWRVARVHSARALDETSRRELVSSLAALTGKSVELQVDEDERLLGGVLVEIGDLRLDATTLGRLAALRESVATSHFFASELTRND
ncbi:MAG TPA: F0F1 ATP synthase subunit delta [Acidimicrobiales bacterium]|nr:F0F1 ATP synthase subunit delta [Acidimicrobiales bacterium]